MTDNTDDKQLQKAVDSIVGGNPATLTASDVEALSERYPYFTIPAAELLKNQAHELDADLKKRLTTRVALSATNPTDLYMLLEPDNGSHAHFYPDTTPKRPTTENAIERFFDNFATTSPEEEELLNRLIFNPTPDYAQILAAEDTADLISDSAEPGSDDDRINRFILANREEIGQITLDAPTIDEPNAEPRSEKPAEPKVEFAVDEQTKTEETPVAAETQAPTETKGVNDSLLSESLARIFIRQRQYEHAYEIIEQLNLNFPEKSVYFADQLRFLRKLINYEKLKSRK